MHITDKLLSISLRTFCVWFWKCTITLQLRKQLGPYISIDVFMGLANKKTWVPTRYPRIKDSIGTVLDVFLKQWVPGLITIMFNNMNPRRRYFRCRFIIIFLSCYPSTQARNYKQTWVHLWLQGDWVGVLFPAWGEGSRVQREQRVHPVMIASQQW